MNRLLLWAGTLGTVAAVVAACGGNGTPTVAPQQVTVTRGTLRAVVSATGVTQYVSANNLTFGGNTATGASGRVLTLSVKEGDRVTKDQVLATLEASDLQQALDQANANLLLTQKSMDDLLKTNGPTDVAKAQQNQATAQVQVQNAQTALLQSQQGITQAQSLAAQAQVVATAQNTLQAATNALAATKDGSQRQSDLAVAQQAISTAQTGVDAAQSDYDQAVAGTPLASAQANLESAKDTLANVQAQLPVTQSTQDRAVADSLKTLQEVKTTQQALLARNFGIAVSLEETQQEPVVLTVKYPPTFFANAGDVPTGWVNVTKALNTYNNALGARDTTVNNAKKAVTTAQDAVTAAQTALVTAQSNAGALGLSGKQARIDAARATLAIAKLTFATLQNTPLSLDVDNKQAAFDQAQANLDAAKLNLAQLQKTPASVDIASKQASLAVAQAALKDAQDSLKDVMAGPDPALVAQKKASLQASQTSVQSAKDNLAHATLKAPYDGILTAVNIHVGDNVGANTTAMAIIDPTRIQVQATVDESEILKVRVGQQVLVNLTSALPNSQVPGVVSAIIPAAKTTQGIVSYPINVELTLGAALQGALTNRGAQAGGTAATTGTPAPTTAASGAARPGAGAVGQGRAGQGAAGAAGGRTQVGAGAGGVNAIFGGLSATVSVIIQEVDNVLIVPSRAITRAQGNVTATVVKADGTKEVRPVKTSQTDGTNVEVTEGLAEGETVVLPAAAARTSTNTQQSQTFGTGGNNGRPFIPGR